MLAQQFHFFICICSKLIESYNHCLTERTKITDMLVQIAQSFFQSFHIRFFNAVETDTTMHFQSLCRSHDYSQTWLESALTAFDIVELLRTEVGTESGFRNHIIAE